MQTAELVTVSCSCVNDRRYLMSFWLPDINECSSNNGNCSQICTNTNGSFICSCRFGYVLNADSRTCNG